MKMFHVGKFITIFFSQSNSTCVHYRQTFIFGIQVFVLNIATLL